MIYAVAAGSVDSIMVLAVSRRFPGKEAGES